MATRFGRAGAGVFRRSRSRVTICGLFLAIGLTATDARGCPLCKDSATVSDARSGEPVADTAGLNFNPSIYGLLGGVTVAAGVAGVAMFKAARD